MSVFVGTVAKFARVFLGHSPGNGRIFGTSDIVLRAQHVFLTSKINLEQA